MSQHRGIWRRQVHLFALPYLLLLASPCEGFLPDLWSRVLTLSWDSHTHQYITERAILNVTLETLRGLKKHHGNHDKEEVRSCLQSGDLLSNAASVVHKVFELPL